VAGNIFKAQEYIANKADMLCAVCSQWGHSEFRCPRSAAVCAVCSGNHRTEAHKCEVATCGAIGRACPHTVMKCPNCGGNHPAKDARCQAKLMANAVARGMRNGSHGPEAQHTLAPRIPTAPPTPQADQICPVSAATLAALRDIPAADWSEDQDELEAAMDVDTAFKCDEPSGTVPPVAA